MPVGNRTPAHRPAVHPPRANGRATPDKTLAAGFPLNTLHFSFTLYKGDDSPTSNIPTTSQQEVQPMMTRKDYRVIATAIRDSIEDAQLYDAAEVFGIKCAARRIANALYEAEAAIPPIRRVDGSTVNVTRRFDRDRFLFESGVS